ncbi:hypothetical protein DPMN_170296 [Dreissena polymorpha]|uniref:Uncharacterized protein n=1 Tax=Dreissena polymorpha TaxID=45954 RepID=A0A9D4DZ70_DREPO|nr:hypothetical protein DPMN_170296 [Dreissena polymorpha]
MPSDWKDTLRRFAGFAARFEFTANFVISGLGWLLQKTGGGTTFLKYANITVKVATVTVGGTTVIICSYDLFVWLKTRFGTSTENTPIRLLEDMDELRQLVRTGQHEPNTVYAIKA